MMRQERGGFPLEEVTSKMSGRSSVRMPITPTSPASLQIARKRESVKPDLPLEWTYWLGELVLQKPPVQISLDDLLAIMDVDLDLYEQGVLRPTDEQFEALCRIFG